MRPRLLIGLFLLATVLVDVAARTLAARLLGIEDADLVLLPLYFSQVSLVAIWMGLGRTPAAMRIAVGLPILIALGDPQTLSSVVWYRPLIDFTAQVAGAVAIPLLVARLFGLQLVDIRSAPTPPPTSFRARWWQFSIRFQFGLMTALAVILGTLQWTGSYAMIPATYRVNIYDRIVLLALGHSFVAWAAIWAALGVRATTLRMVVLAMVVLCACAFTPMTLFHYFYVGSAIISPPNGLFILPEAALLLGSLWVFRRAGYRVAFRRSAAAEKKV
jgi:hypothetical protein